MNRKEYLLELIDSIYGKGNRKVNYNYEEYIVKRQSGLCDKVNTKIFNSRKSMGSYAEQFKTLFTMTFVDEGTEFDIEYNGTEYTRDIALKNARQYFIENGVEFLLWRDITINDYDHLIIAFLNEYIIPAIFYSRSDDSYDELDLGDEDISREFNSAIKRINDKIFSEMISMKHRVKNKEVLKLSDRSFNDRDYNYAVPMTLYSVIERHHIYFAPIVAYVERYTQKKEENCDKPQETFKEMLTGYVKLPLNPDGFFNAPEGQPFHQKMFNSFLMWEKSEIFYISSVDLDSSVLEDRDFYFITFLDEYNLKSSNSNIMNHEDLHKYLTYKAKIEVEEYLKPRKYEYYNNMLAYIEDVVRRIFSIDLELFIDVEAKDLEEYRKNIECFNVNADYIISYLDGCLNSQIQIYLMIERIIHQFSESLSRIGVMGAVELYSVLSGRDIKAHMNKMSGYAESDYLNNAIQHQKNSVKQYPHMYRLPKNDNNNMNGVKSPSLYVDLKKTLEKYCYSLNEGSRIQIDNNKGIIHVS